MVAIGRALVREPRLLLLDEPSFGLAPLVVEAIFELLRRLRSDGSAIVLVEQHEAALDVADRGYRMERGALRAAVR
jgi:branched-chain amino acid transport system ATP-binding protein